MAYVETNSRRVPSSKGFRGTLFLTALFMYHFAHVHGGKIDTVQLMDRCGDPVIMILENMLQMRIVMTSSPGGTNVDCDVTIESWYTWDRLMIYFESFDMSCDHGAVSFLDGENSTVTILDRTCDTTATSQVYSTVSRFLRIKYSSTSGGNHVTDDRTKFSVVITAFSDLCRTNSFQCLNGRCIDKSLKCNGFNSCGDSSDCKEEGMSTAKIIRIVVGIVAGVCILVVGIVVACHFCGDKQSSHKQTTYYGQQNFTDEHKTIDPLDAYSAPGALSLDTRPDDISAIANGLSTQLHGYPQNFNGTLSDEHLYMLQSMSRNTNCNDDDDVVLYHRQMNLAGPETVTPEVTKEVEYHNEAYDGETNISKVIVNMRTDANIEIKGNELEYKEENTRF